MKRRFGLARSSSAAFVVQKETTLSCFYSSLQSLAGKGQKPCYVTCGTEFVCCLDDLLSGRFFVNDLVCGKFVFGMSAFGCFYTFSCELFVIFRSHNTPSHHLDLNGHIHYSAR